MKFLVLVSARALFATIPFVVLTAIVLGGVVIQSTDTIIGALAAIAALAWFIGRMSRGR